MKKLIDRIEMDTENLFVYSSNIAQLIYKTQML